MIFKKISPSKLSMEEKISTYKNVIINVIMPKCTNEFFKIIRSKFHDLKTFENFDGKIVLYGFFFVCVKFHGQIIIKCCIFWNHINVSKLCKSK